MLEFLGQPVRHCDGISRRSFLRAGALGIGSLTLANLLRAEDLAQIRNSRKAIINIHLDGGPPQMDMIDPKPEAPQEIRGDFKPIRTAVPGLHVTDLMPRLAKAAKDFVFLRSLVGAASKHDAFQCLSGFPEADLQGIGGRPAMGCVISKLLGDPQDQTPAYVDIMQGRGFVRNSARPGFLGPAYRPFRPDMSKMFKRTLEDGMKIELRRLGANHSIDLNMVQGLSADRLDDRLALLQSFDQWRSVVDGSGAMEAMDHFHQQAFSILTSGKLAEAMDLSREPARNLERYTPNVTIRDKEAYTSEGPKSAQKFLMARRLVEAGVRCVSVSLSDFDTHSRNTSRMRDIGPILDHALTVLIEDLKERDLIDDVLVVAWGEFGRTPKINAKGGRDHWPRVAMGLMAGGGLKTGQVIGSTDKYAGEATSRPVHYQDVIATLYHHLGINPHGTTVQDTTGRPQYLLDVGQPIREII